MNQAIAFPVYLKAYLFATAILALCVVTPSAAADLLTGRVVHVIDGDGLIVLVRDQRVNVRLLHVDAPERGQAYGHQSRQSLIAICGGELATIESSGKDRNGWILGRVNCAAVDAGAEQVRQGMAWVIERYVPPESPLPRIQEGARAARRGLWSDSRSVPPWAWREQRRATSNP